MARMGRAAVYEAPNTPFVIREYPVRPVERGEVLVRNTMSTICRSDIHSWEGRRPNPRPGLLGHEIVGVIEEIGAGVGPDLRGQPLAVGDRVTWTEFFHDGPSYYRETHDLPQKAEGVRKYGHESAEEAPHFLGGFAEYCLIQPGTGVLKLPEALSDEEATPLNCAVATMVAVIEAAGIETGDAVVIVGLGLLGLYGCALARVRGARLVIGLDAVGERLALAPRFGADAAFDVTAMNEEALVGAVRTMCAPDGADAVIEVCGVPEVLPPGLRMLRAGGRCAAAGLVNPGANVVIDANVLVRRMLTITGVHNYHPGHLVTALDFVMGHRDRFPFRDVVEARFSLDRIDEAFRKAAERTVLRAAIVP